MGGGREVSDLRLLLPSSRVEHLAVVRGSQVRREEPHRGQVDRPCRKHLEDDGRYARRSPGPGGRRLLTSTRSQAFLVVTRMTPRGGRAREDRMS